MGSVGEHPKAAAVPITEKLSRSIAGDCPITLCEELASRLYTTG
jgi:hypothetical protein